MTAPLPANLAESAERHAMITRWVDKLFGWFQAAYGAKCADQWGGTDLAVVKAVWAEELADLTDNELLVGKEACKTRPWPPTLPEFRQLCRPSLNMAALFHLAVLEMGKRRRYEPEAWPDNRTFWAAQRLGNDLLQYPYTSRDNAVPSMRGRWESAWRDALADQGKPIPKLDQANALPAPGKTTLSKAEAEELTNKLRLNIKRIPLGAKVNVAWAEAIASNPTAYPRCSVEMAIKALHNTGKGINDALAKRAVSLGLGHLFEGKAA